MLGSIRRPDTRSGHRVRVRSAQRPAAILDWAGADTASIVGHSMGTLVVQQFASNHPDRCEKIALLGPVRGLGEAGRQAQHDRAATVRDKGTVVVATAISTGATSPAVKAEQPAEEIAADFDDATVQIIDAIGHWTAVEASHTVTTALARFLSTTERATAS